MRNFLILFLFCFASIANGQDKTNLLLAVDHIKSHAERLNLKSADYKNLLISSEVTTDKGITYLYLNQSYNNIPIRNAMMTVIVKQGKVVSDFNNFVTNVESRIVNKSAKIKPEAAIANTAEHFGLSLKGQPTLANRTDNGKLYFDWKDLSKSVIPAELKYELVDEKLVLVWNLNIDMKSSANYWDINIDANNGSYVSKHNYTTYCQHQHDAFANHSKCNIRTFRKISDQTISVDEALSLNAAARYNVYALPAESPIHGGRSIVTDAQFPKVSPFGWHDTNGVDGAEYTTTRGNNVYAYQDKNDDDQSDGPETDGGAGLNFDFPMDLTKDPRESADAAVTNLFYMVNMMHDVSAMIGFTEEFGNFQQKNYTDKGDGGDYVLAQAFDGITLHEAGQTDPVKINNANFSTPPDGFNGRMQMYFWNNSGGAISIDSPESIKGFLEYGLGEFGGVIPANNETPIKGNIVVVNDGSVNSLLGCNPLANKDAIKGNIALIDRGVCEFGRKVLRAQQAGAIAAIICNIPGVDGGTGESVIRMSGGVDGTSVTIPSISLKKSDCDKIRFVISNGGTVTATFQERSNNVKYLDGALDNGIIAHEFGHGISTRLTGGRSNSACLSNDEQMGEGWSDFFSLIMTHEPGDSGADARGIGTFADAQTVEGKGIRRFPYSTDMNINPQTYKDIKGTTGPHPLGEVWACILWDLYWNFVDKYGYDPDWNNEESGNFRSVFLVMEGMKIQNCNPNFILGRNAILKADSIHYGGANGKLLWETFARRGVGFYAKAGITRGESSEDFEILPTLIEKLKITKTASSSVDPGGEITVTIKTINHIPSRQNSVIVTDELPSGMSYVSGSSSIVEPTVSGNLITFELGDMDYKKELTFTYKTRSSLNNKSQLLVRESFDNDPDWVITSDKGSETWFTNVDLFRSPEISYSIINTEGESDASLFSIPLSIQGNNPALRFWHRYNVEAGNDGGFLEVSVNNGLFAPLTPDKFIRNGYNGSLAYSTLALPNLFAFTGNSGGNWSGEDISGPWVETIIDLSEYKGKDIVIKFRFGSNASVNAAGDFTGWYIDDFEILDIFKYSAEACIIADNGNGAKACTLPIETVVNSDGTVNTENFHSEYFSLNLHPNPAVDIVLISTTAPLSTLAYIEFQSADGRSILTTTMQADPTIQTKSINVSSFPAGLYIVKIQSGDKLTTRKLIIK